MYKGKTLYEYQRLFLINTRSHRPSGGCTRNERNELFDFRACRFRNVRFFHETLSSRRKKDNSIVERNDVFHFPLVCFFDVTNLFQSLLRNGSSNII